MFVSPVVAEKAVAVCKRLDYVKNVILIDGRTTDKFVISLNDLVEKSAKVANFIIDEKISIEVDEHDQVAFIFCSSGTTGIPKGVEITQENFLSCLQTFQSGLKVLEAVRDHSLIALNIAPWFHVVGFVSMFMFTCSPDPVFIFLPKFEEIAFYETIQKFKVNFLVVVPPIMVLLAKSPLVDNYDLSSIEGKFKKIQSSLL